MLSYFYLSSASPSDFCMTFFEELKMTFAWKPIKEYSDIRFELFEGIAKITINRPEVRNAFSPVTVARWEKRSRSAASVRIFRSWC